MRIVYYIVALFSFFSSVYVLANTTDEVTHITWLQSNTAPFHLAKTAQTPDGGLCDYLVEQLISELPDIKHTRLMLPQKRIGKYLDEGQQACFPCMIHRKVNTPRVFYSVPTTVYPPFAIIASAKTAKVISQQHSSPINLVKLLTDNKFIFGQSAARKFTPELNTIARNTKSDQHTSLSWNSENESSSVINRLNHGYIDYTIDYPFLADYYNRFSEFDNVVTLPIADHADKLVLGAIGCSTNAPNNFANNALKKINRVLTNSILPSAKYQQTQRILLENTFAEFDQQYQQQILKLTQPTTLAEPISLSPSVTEQ